MARKEQKGMKIKILKPLSRFVRGLTLRTRVALSLLLAAALILAGFGLYLLVRPEGGASGQVQTLFESVDRSAISSVRCHTVSGEEYTVKGAVYTLPDEGGNPKTYKYFYVITSDGEEHTELTINSTQLSYFVVGTGKNYVYSPVITAPKAGEADYDALLAAYKSKEKELGFTEGSAYYELTTETGAVYRVYYGIKDVTGDGYYVRLAGDDTIYSTKSAFVGDLLQESGPESLLDCTLLYAPQNMYAYAFPASFSVRDYVRHTTAGTVVNEEHYAVGYTLIDEDGKRLSGSLPLKSFEGESAPSRAYREAVSAFFLGKELGECKETFTFTYPDTEEMGELRGKKVSIYVETVDYVMTETLRFRLKYLMAEDRELSQKFTSYAYLAPADITSYIPDTDAVLGALENTIKLSGKVIKLGLDDDTLTKYGLYRHQIWITYPFGQDVENENGYIEGRLYVSDTTERGTRYVASYSHGIVAEVDASTLDFMDKTPLEMVDDSMITATITDVSRFQMFWNYGEGKWLSGGYDFEATIGEETGVSGDKHKVISALRATPVGGGETLTLNPDTYYELYARLTYTSYRGEHGLSDEALSALLADRSKCALRLVMTLSADGADATNYWEFYPISANRVLVVAKNGAYSSPSARFVIYGTALSDIANGYLCLMQGLPFDYEQRYD